ncbi:hypothetical protein X798_06941 [Onchocerca flexuosa]|uniref:Serine aminopeptidase S33 domain-containing protein n=1 Tax=Onchocerca flexuosa TaxID=387005 RepID=A0A238BM13_9BILA|nr:hypothetical protein X798_06941 [Onchocerca flexuosa]
MISIVSGEEISNLEPISAMGILMNDGLPSNTADNVRSSARYHFHHGEWKKSLKQSSNLKKNGGKKEECVGGYSQSTNHFELHHANPEVIQQAPKRYGCSCCQFCMLLLKYTGILCYVFCCPPIPEMITRKLAFHPPSKGRTYIVIGMNAHGNLVRTNNAKKASKFISLKFEAQHLIEASPVPMEGIEIAIIKTRRGSYLPILRIKNLIYESSDESKNLVVLFSQPNSSDLGCYFQPHGINFRNISDLLQIDLYAYDYSGYGISTDSPSEKNIYADVEAAYKHIFESQGPHVRIALLGYSIGTAPTVYMASKHPPNLCGIVLIAPFASGLRLCGKAERTWCLDRFLNYDRAPQVNVPVLICHGCMDNVVPKSHSELLVEQFPRAVAPFFIEHANHLTIFSGHFPSVFIRIRHFLFHETDPLQHSLV